MTIDEIDKAASQHDIVAKSVLHVLYDSVSRAMAELINFLDLDIISLADSFPNLKRMYVKVPRNWPGRK